MEVATTSNHNQAHHNHHHRHHHHQHHNHQHQQQHTTQLMPHHSNASNSGGTRSPFQREVREWQRIDPETGALLSGRLEADRWINGPLNSYGKISDSQNISKPNGTQHTQRKQLEILQSQTANGAMQVIRSQTVQTTSSRWSNPPTPSPTLTTATRTNETNTAQLLDSLNNFTNKQSSNSFYQNNNSSHHHHHHHSSNLYHKPPNLTEFSTLPLLSLTVSPSQTPQSPTTTAATTSPDYHWPKSLSNVEITEADDDDYVANDNVASFVGGYIVDDSEAQDYLLNGSSSNSTIHSYNSSINNSNEESNNTRNSYFQRLNSNSTLMDTAPSLKLSNLMKSSSSISSNNSSTNSLMKGTASSGATMNNTHRVPGKISLHAIVGNNNNNNNGSDNTSWSNNKTTAAAAAACSIINTPTPSTTTTTTTSALVTTASDTSSTTTPWQQQLRRRSNIFEQPDLFGNNMSSSSSTTTTNNNTNINLSSLTKSHVGVSNAVGKSMHSSNAHDDDGDVENDVLRFKRQQSIELTPTQSQANRQLRQLDLESFRHYNNNNIELSHSSIMVANNNNNVLHTNQCQPHHLQTQRQLSKSSNDDDADEMRLSTRQQRRQQLPSETNTSLAALQRSRSISTDDLCSEWNTTDTRDETPSDWRRVSKLRRSFQLSNKSETNQTPKRPVDLPINFGNVAKIRAELENKRRELLSSITTTHSPDQTEGDDVTELKPKASKRSTFLTAETLRQIRGNLKQLSDESLYKDDLWALRKSTADERKLKAADVLQNSKSPEHRISQLTPEQSPEIITPKSAFEVVAQRTGPTTVQNKTHSLESRQKLKDTNSAEWHFRRKSYGFEKMSPPEDRVMFRMDASTDSGLGRSGELANWSPTETTANKQRSTIVQFGDGGKPQPRYQSPTDSEADDYNKRHSIAVDESHYMRKATQVHINGNSNDIEHSTTATTNALYQRKRVEFCKTEVHFAAESGRVNIVETDGKPPPTNNFRRRRRVTAGPLQSLVKAAVASTEPHKQFGEDELLLSKHRTISQTTVAYKSTLADAPAEGLPSNVTVLTTAKQHPQIKNMPATENARNSYASTSGIDTTDNENDEIAAIRGILKNKPVKPKPYHLGDNIEKPTDLWNAQQVKTISASATINETMSFAADPTKFLTDRIRLADQQHDVAIPTKTNGFSTKINVSLGDAPHHTTIDHGIPIKQMQRRHQPASVQEILLEDLRAHQRILDEGLKSTSLIIKTMRSANEFDEAMRRLSIASLESAVVPATIVVPTPMLRSQSYQDSTVANARRYSTTSFNSVDSGTIYKSASYSSTTSLASTIRRYSTDSNSSSVPQTHGNANNFQFVGNTISQQLMQLRHMYDVQDDDSADEEVKSYFLRDNRDSNNSDSGGGTQESSSHEDEQFFESSNSWSRLKAKRTIWKINDDKETKDYTEIRQKIELPCTETPKSSNKMSIALHSPQSKIAEEKQSMSTVPIAKPRTLTNVARNEQPQVQVAHTVRQSVIASKPTSPIKLPKDSLKIIKEARGARKLREHELSYFGVPVAKDDQYDSANDTSETSAQRQHARNISKNLKTETQLTNDVYDENQTNHWHRELTNQQSNLHAAPTNEINPTSSISVRPTVRKSLQNRHHSVADEVNGDNEHVYENITNELKPVFVVRSSTPVQDYDRKTDVKRDAMILNEMTRNADQTLKSISDEAALKDQRRQRRHSLQRNSMRPLETIDEKIFTEKINDKCIAVNVARGTFASEARRNSRHSTPSPNNIGRSSSQSSAECPRARSRSRSLSSEREYENAPVKPSRTGPTASGRQRATAAKQETSRSSSLDSQQSQRSQRYSSDEEVPRRTRWKRITTLGTPEHGSSKHKSEKSRDKSLQHPGTSTLRSSRTERNKCLQAKDTSKRAEHSHARVTSAHHSHSRRQQRADDIPQGTNSKLIADQNQQRSFKAHHDKDNSLTRSGRQGRVSRSSHDAHNANTQRSSSRSDRAEREREKLTRSSGHSSRSNQLSTASSTTTTRQREHKKHSASKKHDSNTTSKHNTEKITSSKNAIAAGAVVSNDQHAQHHMQYHQHPIHVHKITTAAVAAKHREHRSGKDRK